MGKGKEGQEGAILCDSEPVRGLNKNPRKCRVCGKHTRGYECLDCVRSSYELAMRRAVMLPGSLALKHALDLVLDEDISLTHD